MMGSNRDQLTPREHAMMEAEKERLERQLTHQKEMKAMELEVLKIEAKISSWVKLPLVLLKLPVLIILAIGYCIDAIKGQEPSDRFWNLLK